MALPTKATPHTATLRSHRQQFVLAYDNGTAAFTPGKTLTGATSHATATIVSVTGTTATGTLTLHTITGTFQDNEVLIDNGTVPGAAVANGTLSEAFDSDGQLVYTNVDTVTACNLYRKLTKVQLSGQSAYIETGTRIMLPATVTPTQGDLVITTQDGFAGTWTLGSPDPKKAPGPEGAIGHWECDLAKAGV